MDTLRIVRLGVGLSIAICCWSLLFVSLGDRVPSLALVIVGWLAALVAEVSVARCWAFLLSVEDVSTEA